MSKKTDQRNNRIKTFYDDWAMYNDNANGNNFNTKNDRSYI